MGATVSQGRAGSRLNIRKMVMEGERCVGCFVARRLGDEYAYFTARQRGRREDVRRWMGGWVPMWACWVGRLVGWRSEVGGWLMVLGWVGWVGLEADSKQRQRQRSLCSYHHFSHHRVQRRWRRWRRGGTRGGEMNTVFFLPVGSRDLCVCVVKKRKPSFSHQFGECLVFLVCLFFPPGEGGAGVRELGGEKGVLEVWILEGSFLSSLPPSPNSLTLRLSPTSVCRSIRVSPCTLNSELGGYRFRAG